MGAQEDAMDYLEIFEKNMKDREIPKEAWASHLNHLLNATARAAVKNLTLEQQDDYTTLREAILTSCQEDYLYPGKQFMQAHIK